MDQKRAEDWTCRDCGHVEAEAKLGVRCPDCSTTLVPARELESAPHDSVLGPVMGAKYGVIGVLGTGGFGTVYRAVQDPVGRPVALELVHAHRASDPDLRAPRRRLGPELGRAPVRVCEAGFFQRSRRRLQRV
jgi:serine/threonine protein kinase